MRLYVVFGDYTEKLCQALQERYEIAGSDRTLEAAVAAAQSGKGCPDAYLVLGTALASGMVDGRLDRGAALVRNLDALRRACPSSRVVVVLGPATEPDLVKNIVRLGIYDVRLTSRVTPEELAGFIENPMTYADHGLEAEAGGRVEGAVVEEPREKRERGGIPGRLAGLFRKGSGGGTGGSDSRLRPSRTEPSAGNGKAGLFRARRGEMERPPAGPEPSCGASEFPVNEIAPSAASGVSPRERTPVRPAVEGSAGKMRFEGGRRVGEAGFCRVAVASPWVPGGSSCLAAALARELIRKGVPVSCVDCDLRGRGLGVRLGLSPAELWEWDWRSAEEPAELKDGTVLWALDPYRRVPDGEDLASLLERILSEVRAPAALDLGTDPDAWWFRLALRHADALVWVVRADPLLLARALACWRDREPAGVPELLVLWGEGNPEEVSALFGLECVQVRGPEDRRGLRELLSAMEDVPARGVPVVLLVGFRKVPPLDGFEAVSFRTGYEAAGWLEGNIPAAVVLPGDMPDLVPFLRALREDPRLARVPVGVFGGGPEALEAGADDVLFEVSAEAVELLLAKGRRLGKAREEAETDPLTGLPNRRAGERMLEALARRCRERGEHLSVALLDLDGFKQINDVHGHPAGDAVLKAFGEFLRANLRSSDLACRWGGEEFLLAFPNTPVSGAVRACENLLGKWRTKSVPHDGAALFCTFSAGVAPCPGFPADAVAEADRALLRAKAEGKGRVVAAGRAEAARAG